MGAMRRISAWASSFMAAAILTIAALPAAASETARADLSPAAAAAVTVNIQGGTTPISADGSVDLTIRARCEEGLNAFELDAGIRQETAFGSVTLLGPNVTVCDGRWHRITVTVRPETGAFQPGPAAVNVFLAAFDPVDGDLEAQDSATVRLR